MFFRGLIRLETNMYLETVVADLLDAMTNSNRVNADLISQMSWYDQLKEFRTVGVRAPRRSGKTTILKNLQQDSSCMLLHKHILFGPTLESNPYRLYRGRKSDGIKFSALLLDEFNEVPKEIWPILTDLRIGGFLSPSFFILHLGT